MALSDSFYKEIKVSVDSVIKDLGTTYMVHGEAVYNSDNLNTEEGITRSVAGIVADQQITNSLGSAFSESMESASAWIGTKRLILTADANPLSSEKVEVDGVRYSLSKVIPIKPADIIIAYILDLVR